MPERDSREAPMGIVIARPGGAVKDERTLLGGTRLDEISTEARVWKVRRGDTIASARAKCAGLLVRVVQEQDVRGALEAVAECGLSFGRTASIDESRDVVCFDVTGCGHLFQNEEGLARTLEERIRAVSHGEVRVCIADGPRLSSALARSMRRRAPLIVPPGKNAEAIAQLPIRALPIDEASVAWMEKLGIQRVLDLQKLPMRGLSMRLGRVHAEVAALLAGDDAAPLNPYVPLDVPSDRVDLEYGIENTEALLFVAKMLCDRLALRLSGRAMAATALELELSLDRAAAPEGTPALALLTLASPAPLALSGELLSVVRVRIESWVVPAPVLAVTLRATTLARKDGRALDLFESEAKADRGLPRLVAELTADLGSDRVGTLALVDTWVAGERSVVLPYGTRAPHAFVPLTSSAPEPSRRIPAAACADDARLLRLLARVEGAAWWRCGVKAHDYFASWSESESRMSWVEIDVSTGSACVKGWMD
jgi:protein ImuB